MLDPLTALGLACNILQLVELAGKVAGTAHKVYKSANGALEETVEVENATSDLRALFESLADGARVDNFHWRESEKALQKVARECEVPARKLLTILDGLKVGNAGGPKSWQALRVAVKVLRKKGEVEAIQRQLDGMVSRVSLYLLQALNDETSTLAFDIRELSGTAKQISEESRRQLQDAREQLVAAVSQCQNSLANARSTDWNLRSDSSSGTPLTYQLGIDMLTKLQAISEAAGIIATPKAITQSLLYPEMPMRRIQIPDSYEATNAWVFDAVESPFPAWLRDSTGVFWINGKAGSGKSTLVKYIADHPYTRRLLEKWAGFDVTATYAERAGKLTIASFYFWKSGYLMQRSLQGLLQSIVFYIFSQCPGLISTVCPERWQKDNAFHRNPEPWSVPELSRVLEALLKIKTWPSRFCFFIDGLDEYAGSSDDQFALVETLDQLATSPFVKICVSSRPWNVFRVAYEQDTSRKLVLQHHNKKDLDVYISGKLEKDRRFRRLASTDARAHDFAIEIRNRANGVFLWVFLVVRSLLDGLTEEDDVPMLQTRLRSLPPTLEDYFRHMLDSIDVNYKRYTARALLLASNATQPLSILPYYYLETELGNPQYALQASIEPATPEDMEKRKRRVVSWVNKWCRDLLEVNERSDMHSFTDPVHRYSVDFIHRTARDFLVMGDMQALFQVDAGHEFNVRLSLCRSYLAQVKHLSNNSKGRDFVYLAGFLMYHAKECEAVDLQPPIAILNDLDDVGTKTAQYFNSEHWTSACPRTEPQEDERHNSFLAYAIEFDLQLYVQHVLDNTEDPLAVEAVTSLALCAQKPTLKHEVFHGAQSPRTAIHAMLPHCYTRGQLDEVETSEHGVDIFQDLERNHSANTQGQTNTMSRSIRQLHMSREQIIADDAMALLGTSQVSRSSFSSGFLDLDHPGLYQTRSNAMKRYQNNKGDVDRLARILGDFNTG